MTLLLRLSLKSVTPASWQRVQFCRAFSGYDANDALLQRFSNWVGKTRDEETTFRSPLRISRDGDATPLSTRLGIRESAARHRLPRASRTMEQQIRA
jgi:hypothetical protein